MSSTKDISDWDKGADAYAEGVEAGPKFSYVVNVLDRLIGDVNRLRVLDLGCGQGWLAGHLRAAGAEVTGIDGSANLLELARRKYGNIKFLQADLANGLPDLDGQFDLAVSHTVVMDLPDVDHLFKDVSVALVVGGRFVFSLLHPCFWNQKSHRDDETGDWHKRVRGYLNHEVWRVKSFGGHNHYHRPISYYTSALHRAGLVIRQLLEPEHEPSGGSEIPDDFIRRFPLFLVIEAVNQEDVGTPNRND